MTKARSLDLVLSSGEIMKKMQLVSAYVVLYTTVLCVTLVPFTSSAESEFNLDFIRNIDGVDPSIFDLDTTSLPENPEYLKVIVNKKLIKEEIVQLNLVEGKLCAPEYWLDSDKFKVDYDSMEHVYVSDAQCFLLQEIEHSSIEYHRNLQKLTVSLPKIYEKDSAAQKEFDFGTMAIKLNYHVNAYKTEGQDTSTYLNLQPQLNFGTWSLQSQWNGSTDNRIQHQRTNLYRALPDIESELYVGELTNYPEHSSSFNFKGFSLGTDSSIRDWGSNIYAPELRGIAQTAALVSVYQNGEMLSQFSVTPGPFMYNNYTPTGNGDITLEIKETNGEVQTKVFPVAVLPNMLRSGISNYHFSIGSRDTGDKPMFLNMNYITGLSSATASASTILSPGYGSLGFGFSKPMLGYGSITLNANLSYAQLQLLNDDWKFGSSINVKYAKRVSQYTDVQLIGYHYADRDYIDFANYSYKSQIYDNKLRKQRYEFVVNNSFKGFSIRGSGWAQNYWDHGDFERGINLSLSSRFKRVSYSVNLDLQDNQYGSETSIGLNLAMPLGGRSFISNSFYYRKQSNEYANNVNYTSAINDRFNYGVDLRTSKDSEQLSARASYRHNLVNLGATVSHGNDSTALSASASGSVVALPKQKKLLFSNQKSTTLAVVNVEGIENIKLSRGGVSTNSQGLGAAPLSANRDNRVSINSSNVTEDIELYDPVAHVRPVKRSVHYLDFDYRKVNLYIFRLLDSQGNVLPFGSKIRISNATGTALSFVSNDGVTQLTLDNTIENKVFFADINGQSCRFNLNTVQSYQVGETLENVKCI